MKAKICTGRYIALAIWTVFTTRQLRAADNVLYESMHIRFVEVTHLPGDKDLVSDERYPAILAVDAVWPTTIEEPLDTNAVDGETIGNRATPPLGKAYPWCAVETKPSARTVTVTGTFPQHYYRIEYKRIDGDGYAAKWAHWYPWILDRVRPVKDMGYTPQPGTSYSEDYPYPNLYDPTMAAPANHYVRYEDAHVQLVEVVIRPGEKENMHGHPYSSVFADDGGGFYPPIKLHNDVLNPKSINPRGIAGVAPGNERYPTCYAAIPEWPHAVTVTGKVAQHFYRLHFKYLDGDGIMEPATQSAR
jgi:hypothetical protein